MNDQSPYRGMQRVFTGMVRSCFATKMSLFTTCGISQMPRKRITRKRRKIMENRAEQKEALETLVEFNQRLVKNMNIIIKELEGERLDDTDKFLNGIVNAINWEVQVMNGTMGLLNDGRKRIDKEVFNKKILDLASAIEKNDDAKQAEAIQNLIPEFEKLENTAKEVIS